MSDPVNVGDVSDTSGDAAPQLELLDADVEACAAVVERGDPDRFRATMAATPPVRTCLFPLYAFNLEIARAPWVTSEPMLAEIRLQWWRDAIDEIYDGKRPRTHEVVRPLAALIRQTKLARHSFDSMISARKFDIYADGHEDMDALHMYLQKTSGCLMSLAASAITADERLNAIASQLGQTIGAGQLLRALPTLYAAGKNPVPVSGDLDCTALARGDIPQNLTDALQQLAEHNLESIAKIRAERSVIPKAAQPLFYTLWRAEQVLTLAKHRAQHLSAYAQDVSELHIRARFLWLTATGRW